MCCPTTCPMGGHSATRSSASLANDGDTSIFLNSGSSYRWIVWARIVPDKMPAVYGPDDAQITTNETGVLHMDVRLGPCLVTLGAIGVDVRPGRIPAVPGAGRSPHP